MLNSIKLHIFNKSYSTKNLTSKNTKSFEFDFIYIGHCVLLFVCVSVCACDVRRNGIQLKKHVFDLFNTCWLHASNSKSIEMVYLFCEVENLDRILILLVAVVEVFYMDANSVRHQPVTIRQMNFSRHP